MAHWSSKDGQPKKFRLVFYHSYLVEVGSVKAEGLVDGRLSLKNSAIPKTSASSVEPLCLGLPHVSCR